MFCPPKFDIENISEPHLVTIPYSHYCEVARWALDLSKTKYKEMNYMPGFHLKVVGKLRKKNKTAPTLVFQSNRAITMKEEENILSL